MDRRRARTERAVEAAFCALLERKRYARITVQDVLDEADVVRSTFYAHYRGKEDLLARLVDEICAHATAPMGPEPEHDFSARTDSASAVEHLLRHIQERRSGVRALVVGDGAGAFARLPHEALVVQADLRLPAEPGGAAGRVDRPFLVHHIAGSLTDLVIRWAREGFAEDPRQLADQYVILMRPPFS